jgi:hypothetical protein
LATLGRLHWGAGISAAALLGLAGALAGLNPDQEAFEIYATGELVSYLDANLCQELASPLEQLVNLSCKDLLAANQGWVNEVIRDRTQHHNWILFSVYRTTLSPPAFGLLPTYQVDTIGVLGKFYTFQVRQIR